MPAWFTLVLSILFLVVAFAGIFFLARGCVATQESTEVRKYVTESDSLLAESASAGSEELQGALAEADGNPKALDANVVDAAAVQSRQLYNRALQNDEVPAGFEGAQDYLTTVLGLRWRATQGIAEAAGADEAAYGEALAEAAEDYRISDSIAINHFVPVVEEALGDAGQITDRDRIEEPEPFMNYRDAGMDDPAQDAPAASGRSDPNALHGVQVDLVEVGGQPLYPGGEVVLGGSDSLDFNVTVTNGGEAAETGVPVEVILNTSAERQSQTVTIERIEPQETVTVKLTEFKPGELQESADVTVEAGPVKYEELTDNNVLTGAVVFGI